jgi:hypothetical protein
VSGHVDELLRRVDRALEDHARADQTTRAVESLASLEEQLSPYIEDLGRVVAAFNTLDQIRIMTERPETRSLAAACREAAELVREHQSGPQDVPRTFRDIRKVVNDATTTARDAWREFIATQVPDLDSLDDLARTLSQMKADRLQVDNLRTSVAGLRDISLNLPDESAPTQVTAAVAAIHSALTALLGDSDGGNDVRQFVEAVARGGAHVRAMTPDVKDWMNRSGLEDSFMVVVAARPRQ